MRTDLTPTEATRMKNAIAEHAHEIESHARRMVAIVTDHSLTADREVEAMHEVAAALNAIVDRRTRGNP